MLAQVIVRSGTYLHAIQKMQRALYEFHIRGVKTNILFLENVLRHPEFLSGTATTSFIDRCSLERNTVRLMPHVLVSVRGPSKGPTPCMLAEVSLKKPREGGALLARSERAL